MWQAKQLSSRPRLLQLKHSFSDAHVNQQDTNDNKRIEPSSTVINTEAMHEVGDSFVTGKLREKSLSNDLSCARNLTTKRLTNTTDYPIGLLTRDLVEDAEHALELWICDRTKEGFEHASAILDRLVLEQEFCEANAQHPAINSDTEVNNRQLEASSLLSPASKSEESSERKPSVGFNEIYNRSGWYDDEVLHGMDCVHHYYVRTFLLNQVVDGWRTCWKDSKIDSITPTDMLEIVLDYESRGLAPDSRTFTMIIDGMVARGDRMEAPLLAQWLLDSRLDTAILANEEQARQQKYVEFDYGLDDEIGDRGTWTTRPDTRPDTVFITNVIRAWAKSSRVEAPEMADELLQLMHDLYQHKGWSESAPDASSYAMVIETWYNSRRHNASNRIDALLQEMKDSVTANASQEVNQGGKTGDGAYFASIAYTYALNIFANEGDSEKAYNVLQEMLQLSFSRNEHVAPRVSNFSKVMASFARKGNIRRVNELLEQLENLNRRTDGNESFLPDQECRKARLMALARSGNAREAQHILDSLVDRALLSSSQNAKIAQDAIMPKRSYFIDVLVAWTKHRDETTASKMSEKVLIQMLELSSTKYGYSELLPDSKCFEKVMQSWSKVRRASAPKRVESLLRVMDQLCQQQQQSRWPDVKPTCRSFEYALAAWSRSGNREAPDRARALMEDLERRHSSSGDAALRPSRAAYTSLMLTWQRSRRDNAPLAVESFFKSLQKRYHEDPTSNEHLRPDAFMYSVLMGSWAEQGNAEKATVVWDQMIRDYTQNSNLEAKPDIHAFNKVLKAWAMSTDPNKAQLAESALMQMDNWGRSNNVSIQPNSQTYNEMIMVWARSGEESISSAERAEYYLQQLKERRLELSLVSYRGVIDAWTSVAPRNLKLATARCEATLEELLHAIRCKEIRQPLYKPLRNLLQSIARSPIPRRNKQAKELLTTLRKGHVPKELFPR